MKNGKCPAGEYYCYTDKKCKSIPKGFKVVGAAGMLRKENGHSVDDETKNGNGNGNGGSNGGVSEGSLNKWFKGSKSKDGKGGWVNVVTGGTCASDKPGEGTPKCVSSSKRASMSKSERLSASRRKKKADPGQQSKSGAAKPTYVSTDKKKMKEEMNALGENVTSGRARVAKLGKVKGKVVGAVSNDEVAAKLKREKEDNKAKDKAIANKTDVSGLSPSEALFRKRQSERKAEKARLKASGFKKMRREDVFSEEDKKGKGSGTKDACYHKVKSRYSVWPSAYASGALVKCRKKGAANWGNSTKKEGFSPSQIAALEANGFVETNKLGEACWKGYEKKGMKTMFGKRYPNCVKKTKKEEFEVQEAATIPRQNGQVMRIFLTFRGKFYMTQLFFPSLRVPSKAEITDAVQKVYPDARVTQYSPSSPDPTQPLIRVAEEQNDGKNDALDRRDQMIQRRQLVLNRQKLQLQQKALKSKKKTDMNVQTEAKSAAWQRKEGKNKEGGLNEKGRKSYERENPGSDLKAPQPEGGPRKRSFCARMGGLKGPMKDEKGRPTRKALALKKWKC